MLKATVNEIYLFSIQFLSCNQLFLDDQGGITEIPEDEEDSRNKMRKKKKKKKKKSKKDKKKKGYKGLFDKIPFGRVIHIWDDIIC